MAFDQEKNKKEKSFSTIRKAGIGTIRVNKRKCPLTGYLILLIHPVYSSLCSNNARLEPSHFSTPLSRLIFTPPLPIKRFLSRYQKKINK